MKKIFGVILMAILLMTAALSVAEVKMYNNFIVTGLEETNDEREFINGGEVDLVIVVRIVKPNDEVVLEKNIIRYTDCEDDNYNEVYVLLYDEYGLVIDEGTGFLPKYVADCHTRNNAQIVHQLKDYLETENPEDNFEMYVKEGSAE